MYRFIQPVWVETIILESRLRSFPTMERTWPRTLGVREAGVALQGNCPPKTYCLPILLGLYGCETWRMSNVFFRQALDVAWNNCFRKICNARWRESAKPLLFYCGTILVDQRKMIFYKTLRSTNIVLRVVCRLHLYEARDCFQSIMFFQGISAT